MGTSSMIGNLKPSEDCKKSGPSLVEGGALHLVRLGMPFLAK